MSTKFQTVKYEKDLSLVLAKAVKQFGVVSISFLEMEIIEFNDEKYHKFLDATFTDLSVDVEEVHSDLLLLTEHLANELLDDYCQAWGNSSKNFALIWNFKIDFNADQIDVTTRERVMKETKKPEYNFQIA